MHTALIIAIPGVNQDFFKLTLFLQNLANGLSNGALYAAMALTLVMIYRTTGHLNFAQGEMAMFSAFLVFAFNVQVGLPIGVAIIVSIVVSMIAAALLERTLIRPVEKRSPGGLSVLIVTLALFLIVNASAASIWGTGNSTPIPQPFPGGLNDKIDVVNGLPKFFITYKAIGIWATVLAVVVLLVVVLQKTKFGLAYRAVASNRASAELVGIPVGRMLAVAWAVAAGIGVLVGIMAAEYLGYLNSNLMGSVLLYGFAAACLGGFDSIKGAIVGGIIVGLAEALIPAFFSFIGTELSLTMALLVILVVLSVRPQGLFGTKRIERA
jgi:branched-chain amino acid transport system permease protein